MILSPRFEQALQYAAVVHAGQLHMDRLQAEFNQFGAMAFEGETTTAGK